MKKCMFFLILTIASMASCGDDGDIEPQPLPPQPTHPPITTTSTSTPPTTPTNPPNTTTPPPTPTTTKSTTTPTHTTTTKTTPITSTKPTTLAPNTTTMAPTTTTNKPKPIPEPKMGNWSVIDPTTNKSCILLDAAVQIEISHPKLNKTVKINVPTSAVSGGDCKNMNQTIFLNWDGTDIGNDSLKFEFSKVINESKFELMAINFTMSKGQNVTSLYHLKAEFSTPLDNSYRCNKIQTFNLIDYKNASFGYLHISQLQLQAFRNSTGRDFDSAKDCDSSITPDVVPIVVGCVLAALVVAVLVAYLVGRRRCQARGYLSM